MRWPILQMRVAATCLSLLPVLLLAQGKVDIDSLDEADRQALAAHVARAEICKVARDFACGMRELQLAGKYAQGSRDRAMLKAAAESMELARLSSLSDEARLKYSAERSTVERNAEVTRAELDDARRRAAVAGARTDWQAKQEERALDLAVQRQDEADRLASQARIQRSTAQIAIVMSQADRDIAAAHAQARQALIQQPAEGFVRRSGSTGNEIQTQLTSEGKQGRAGVQVASTSQTSSLGSASGQDTATAPKKNAQTQSLTNAQTVKAEQASQAEKEQARKKQADEQKAREERLAKEREEKRRQAALAAQEKKETEQKARDDYFATLKSGIRLMATKCPDNAGHYYATGILPSSRPKGNYCVDVSYEATCPDARSVSRNVAGNFVGMSGCFGDTYRIDPKPACDVKDVVLRVTEVRACQ